MMWWKSLGPTPAMREGLVAGDARGLAERQVLHLGEAHVLGRPRRAPRTYTGFFAQSLRPVGAGEHHRAAGVGDQADVQDG